MNILQGGHCYIFNSITKHTLVWFWFYFIFCDFYDLVFTQSRIIQYGWIWRICDIDKGLKYVVEEVDFPTMLAVVDECRIKVGFIPTCSRRRGGGVNASLHISWLLLKSCINLQDWVDFEVSQRIGLWFYLTNTFTFL